MPESHAIAREEQIEEFKAKWPCHGLPDDLKRLHAYFDSRGDLVDLTAYGPDEKTGHLTRYLDTHEFDGPALVALVADMKAAIPKFNPTPDTDGRFGAPMGRANRNTYTDKQGRTFELTVNEDARPFRLVRCPLDNGGYDRGGAYWGLGQPLYYFEGPLGDISGYVRGNTRELAKKEVRAIHPKAKFFR